MEKYQKGPCLSSDSTCTDSLCCWAAPGGEQSRENSFWGVEKGPVSGGIWPGSQAQGVESLQHQAASYTRAVG